eukprot:m.243037 g.243037  ORF g.243037 m.243037 type:complete len:64 (-) comp33806_c4_seq1:1589-1780(-)
MPEEVCRHVFEYKYIHGDTRAPTCAKDEGSVGVVRACLQSCREKVVHLKTRNDPEICLCLASE